MASHCRQPRTPEQSTGPQGGSPLGRVHAAWVAGRTWGFTFAIAAMLVGQASAAGPDTANRSFIKIPYQNLDNNAVSGNSSSYVRPTSAASTGTFAVVGSGNPRITTNLKVGYPSSTVSANIQANPVMVTGPWDGTPFQSLNITPPVNPAGVERFGSAVAIHGLRIAVSSTYTFTWNATLSGVSCMCVLVSTEKVAGGRVRLYLYDGTRFVLERNIIYGGLEEAFGTAMALNNTHLLVGRPGAVPGAADLFNPGTGARITSFTSPASDDGFGDTVALAGDLAMVGAPRAGTVYVYRRDGTGQWNPAGKLTSPGVNSEFGAAIAAEGTRILVGAPGIDRAYVFEDAGNSVWPVVAEMSGGDSSRFGSSVALTGDTAFISAPSLQFSPNFRIGLVARHERAQDGSWPFTTHYTSRRPKDGDRFGNIITASDTLFTAVENGLTQRPSEYYIYTASSRTWDRDGDGTSDLGDNCVNLYNPDQADLDKDDQGNVCDSDIDNDGLSNTQEANLGTDPYKADTDGDGLNDSEDPYPLTTDFDADGVKDTIDNCPEASNPDQANLDGDAFGDACDADIDNDGITNVVEIANGTNPYNANTDGDQFDDKKDFLPLDPNDGWARVYRFDLKVTGMALGDDVLLVEDRNGLRAYTERDNGWVEVDPPLLDNGLVPRGFWGRAQGNRFVVRDSSTGSTNKRLFHTFEWSNANGWTHLGSVDVSVGQSATKIDLRDAVIGGGSVAVVVQLDFSEQLQIYDITAAGLQLRTAWDAVYRANLTIAGNFLFVTTGVEGNALIYDMANDFALQTLAAPSGKSIWYGLYPVGSDKLLVNARNDSYWLTLQNGTWSLAPTGVTPVSNGNYFSGGDGAVIINKYYDTDQSLNLFRVSKASDGTTVGKLNQFTNDLVLTNGRVVVQAPGVSSSTSGLSIHAVPQSLPPGC